MIKPGVIIICILFFTNVFSQCADTTNIYEFTFNGKNYEVIMEFKSWDSASLCATEKGGYLVEINSEEEQNAVYDAIINGAKVSTDYITIWNGGGIAYVWIGATDNSEEGVWLWDGDNNNSGTNYWVGQGANGNNDGSSVNGAYINWGGTSTGTPQEPDNWGFEQNHGAMGLTGWPVGTTDFGIAGEWNDIVSTNTIFYVIEYDSTSASNQTQLDHKLNIYPNQTNELFTNKGVDIEDIRNDDDAAREIDYYGN